MVMVMAVVAPLEDRMDRRFPVTDQLTQHLVRSDRSARAGAAVLGHRVIRFMNKAPPAVLPVSDHRSASRVRPVTARAPSTRPCAASHRASSASREIATVTETTARPRDSATTPHDSSVEAPCHRRALVPPLANKGHACGSEAHLRVPAAGARPGSPTASSDSRATTLLAGSETGSRGAEETATAHHVMTGEARVSHVISCAFDVAYSDAWFYAFSV
jgi:hypothetical protein